MSAAVQPRAGCVLLAIGCLSASTLFWYARRMGNLYVLGWERIRRVALGRVVLVVCPLSSLRKAVSASIYNY